MHIKPLFLIPLMFLFLGCNSVSDEFRNIQKQFQNFDEILSPLDFAATSSFRINDLGQWVTPTGDLVTLDIPYRDHFFTFGTRYAEQHPNGAAGVWSRYIIRYQEGVIRQRVYELEKLRFLEKQYDKAYYLIHFDATGQFVFAEFLDATGRQIHTENFNFLIS
jgi:hypothetical protein